MKPCAVLIGLVVGLLGHPEADSVAATIIVEDESVRRAKAVVVAQLDPKLPAISLEEWMNALVGEGGSVAWHRSLCLGTHSHPRADYPICVWARGETPNKRVASVSVWMGAGRIGHESWGKPHLEDAFVETANDSFTIERLSNFAQMLRLSPSRWPKADLRIAVDDVNCEPRTPVAGSRVRCDVTFHNDGDVSAATALLVAVLQPQSDVSSSGTRWEGNVAARNSTTVSVTLNWPDGKEWIVVADLELMTPSAYPGYRGVVRERNTSNNRAHLRIP